MNKKLFKIVICGIPVVLGCITACSALSTIASKEQEEKEVDLPEEVLAIDEDNALTGWNYNISWSNKNTYEKYCMCNTLLVPKRVTGIKNYSFYRNIPDFVTTLKFESESLCTKIESNAFWNDLSLKKIVLPSSLTTIEDSAFADCMNIKTMDMSMCRRISSIGDYVIKNCRKITKFSFPENNDTYGWATNLGPNAKVLLQKDSQGKTVWDDTKTIVGSIGLGQIIFPEGIERISKFPATLATKITLPSSLKFLGDGDSYSRGTFESCGALVTVDMSKCNNLESIHQDAFKECYSLKNVIWCQKNNNFGFLDFQNGGMLVDTKDSLGNWVINGDTTPVGRLAYGDIVVSNPDLTTIKNE